MQRSMSNDDDLKKRFEMFDKDGDGRITADEVRAILKQLGDELSDDEVNEVIREADTDGDGTISFEEFAAAMG